MDVKICYKHNLFFNTETHRWTKLTSEIEAKLYSLVLLDMWDSDIDFYSECRTCKKKIRDSK